MWYKYAKEQDAKAMLKEKTQDEAETSNETTTEPSRTTDGQDKHDNVRPNTQPGGQKKDGMNRPETVRYGEEK